MIPTASPVEILWTSIALLGVGVEAYALYDALADRWALRKANLDGPLLLVSAMGLRTSIVALAIQAVFVAIGLLAMTTPDPPTFTLFAIVARAAFVGVAAVIVLASVLNQVDRRRLRRSLRSPS